MLSFNLSQNVVVWIEFLTIIFVSFDCSLVVMGVSFSPLWDWLDVEDLHELIKLDLIVLSSEGLVVHEESVFLIVALNNLLWNGVRILRLRVFFFFFLLRGFITVSVSVTLFLVSLAFFVFVFIIVVLVFFLLFLFNFSISGLYCLSMGATGCSERQSFKLIDLYLGVSLWPL